MFVPTTLAPRLKTLKAARLGLYKARPGGSSKATEQSVYELVEAIGDLLVRHVGLAKVESWTRTKSAMRNESSVLDEIAAASDAVVMGIGDCHHGSAMNFPTTSRQRRSTPRHPPTTSPAPRSWRCVWSPRSLQSSSWPLGGTRRRVLLVATAATRRDIWWCEGAA